jgi:hypothetical protein
VKALRRLGQVLRGAVGESRGGHGAPLLSLYTLAPAKGLQPNPDFVRPSACREVKSIFLATLFRQDLIHRNMDIKVCRAFGPLSLLSSLSLCSKAQNQPFLSKWEIPAKARISFLQTGLLPRFLPICPRQTLPRTASTATCGTAGSTSAERPSSSWLRMRMCPDMP